MELLSRARNDFHFWRSILIALVLIVLPFSCYSDAASWQPFAPGGAGWEIFDSGSAATYRFNGLERLSYNASNGQWSQASGISLSSLNGQEVKLQCTENGQWLDFKTGSKEVALAPSTDGSYVGTKWILRDNTDGTISLESWIANQYGWNAKWLDGQVKDNLTGIQLNSFGDFDKGTRWRLSMNASGVGVLQSIKQDSSSILDGVRSGNTVGLASQWGDVGTTWKIIPFNGSAISWSIIGGSGQSATFIGDGTSHSIGSGWSYTYNGSNSKKQDSAWFSFGGSNRLAYNYTEGQWWQKGTDWSKLGSSGVSSAFVGDGAVHGLGNGWSYMYNGSNSRKQDSAWFSFGGSNRLAYNYTEGQWWQKGVDWSKLGSAGLSTTFIGDGVDHSIGSGWSYTYNGSNIRKQDSAWLAFNGSNRLAYNYTEGQWWQKGVDWSKLGSAGLSTAFIGDGTDRSIGAGWTYMYNGTNARKQDSAWLAFNGANRLAYNYTEGQWWQKGIDWSKVGSAGLSTAFIGDGTDHAIGSGWSYMYNGSNGKKEDSAWFSLNGANRLSYNYAEGQWWQKGTDWSKLGSSGLSTKFIGDGNDYDLKNGWSYSYIASSDQGQWKDGGALRFAYAYKNGQWYSSGVGELGTLSSTNVSSQFIADGSLRDIGSGWSFKYEKEDNIGYWSQPDEYRFTYEYGKGQWYTLEDGSWQSLSAAGFSSTFLGDSQWHDLGNSFQFRYDPSSSLATWKKDGIERFKYHMDTAEWDQHSSGSWSTRSYDYAAFSAMNLNERLSFWDGNLTAMENYEREVQEHAAAEAARKAALQSQYDAASADYDSQLRKLNDINNQVDAARQKQNSIEALNGRIVSIQCVPNNKYLAHSGSDIVMVDNDNGTTYDTKWILRQLQPGNSEVLLEHYYWKDNWLSWSLPYSPDIFVGTNASGAVPWNAWNLYWGAWGEQSRFQAKGRDGSKIWLDGVVGTNEVDLATKSDGGIWWRVLPQPHPGLLAQVGQQQTAVDISLKNKNEALEATITGTLIPKVSLSTLNGQQVKIESIVDGNTRGLLGVVPGTNSLFLGGQGEDSTKWILHDLGDGSVSLESWQSLSSGQTHRWLDGDPAVNSGSVQMNVFGGGVTGSRWNLSFLNDYGLGSIKSIIPNTGPMVPGSYLRWNPTNNCIDLSPQINDQGAMWRVVLFNQEVLGSTPPPTPPKIEDPESWYENYREWGIRTNKKNLGEELQKIKESNQKVTDSWSGKTVYTIWYQHDSYKGLVEDLKNTADEAYETAYKIVGCQGIKRFEVFLVEPGLLNGSNGETWYGLLKGKNTDTSSARSFILLANNIGESRLYVHQDKNYKRDIDDIAGVLAHETVHALMCYYLGGTDYFYDSDVNDNISPVESWSHYVWFTESLAWYAGEVSYLRTIGKYDFADTKVRELGKIIREYIDGDGRDDHLESFTGLAKKYENNNSQDVWRSLTAVGWYLVSGSNNSKTHGVFSAMADWPSISGGLKRTIDQSFELDINFGKPTGQDSTNLEADTFYRDFYNRFINW